MKRSSLAYVFLLPLALAAVSCGSKKDKGVDIPLASARQGTFYIDLYEEGEVQATQSHIINSPSMSWRYGNMLKIATLIEDGSAVEAGDTVMTFDPSDVSKAIVDATQRLEIHYAEREKMVAQQKNTLEGQISDVEVSRIQLEITRLNLESAQYEAEITRKEIALNLEKAEIALQQAEAEIDNTRRSQKEELRQKDLAIRQAEDELAEGYDALERLSVTAPTPGIVIIRRNHSTRAKFQVGEQVWTNQQMIELPNLREMKVELKVNEVDISKVKKGLRVLVRPDAFTDSTFEARVETVANLAVNKSYDSPIKVFPVTVLVTSPVNLNPAQPNLMPGLTVSCRILVDEIPDVTYIPLACLFEKDGQEVVYVKTLNGFRCEKVVCGPRNTDFVVVNEGVKAGDELAMANPFAAQEAAENAKNDAKHQ